jgi:hypothetical protein
MIHQVLGICEQPHSNSCGLYKMGFGLCLFLLPNQGGMFLMIKERLFWFVLMSIKDGRIPLDLNVIASTHFFSFLIP